MKYFYPLFFILFLNKTICGMEFNASEKPLTIYALPGQNGLGSEPDYIRDVLDQDVTVISVETPKRLMDLGQYFCQRYLDSSIKEQNQEGIVYATSQGTATALNYVAQKDRGKKIKALILESILASGNSAIFQTVTGPLMPRMNFIKSAPGSCYWLPYLASFVLPGYRPAGQQPIKSSTGIPPEIPIIIIHSTGDYQLPYDGACALYYILRMSGNKNVYLISKDSHRHIQLLETNYEKSIVRQILSKHKLLACTENFDVKQFQPDPEQFKQKYEKLIAQERKHKNIEALSLASLVTCALYYCTKSC